MTITDAAREAIGQGHKIYTQVVAVSRAAGLDMVGYEQQRAFEDAHRTIGRELALTSEEITARFAWEWVGPYTNEVDDEGNPLPLDEARYLCYKLTFAPRKRPFPAAVYTARRPLKEAACLRPALVAAMDAHDAVPLAVRLHPRVFTDYVNSLQWYGFGEPSCDGVPVAMARGVAEDELVVVFPLPTEA